MSLETSSRQTDDETAVSIARELREVGGTRVVTTRWLRDRFRRGRLTAGARQEIAHALDRAGIDCHEALMGAALDDELVLRVETTELQRWGTRLKRGGWRSWKALVAVLSLTGTVVGLYAFVEERTSDPPPPKPLSGDLNVAVAPFAVGDGGAPASQGERLAEAVRGTLAEQLKAQRERTDVTFRVAPPPELDPLEGASEGERAAAAERVAARLQADIVVYGTVRDDPDETVVTPSFYLSPRSLGDAAELVGGHRLGAPLVVRGSLAGSVAARVELRQLLAARTRTLSEFVVGFSHFARQDFGKAERWFERAEQASETAGGDAGEVVHLFLGHAAGRSGNFAAAEDAYSAALRVAPEYARARFGIAEVRFQRAHGGCRRGQIDEAGVREAIRGYAEAESGREQPYGALLRVRARFARGRALLCLSQAGLGPYWGEAEALLREVVRAYDRGEDRLRDEASEALGNIALIQLPGRGDTAPEEELRTAAASYERALSLSRDPDRQAVFWSMLGFIHGRLGDQPAAERAYRRAIALDPDADDRRRYENERRALSES
jgi:tetratricopeptide (TPR) repeat protein